MQTILTMIAEAHGHAFISPSATLNAATLNYMASLARHFGMDEQAIAQARPTDLISLYAVARGKGETAGRRQADKVALAIAARNAPTAIPSIAPQPQPAMAPAIDLEALKDTLRGEVAAMVAAGIAAMRPAEPLHLIVTTPATPAPVALGLSHKDMPYVLQMLAAGENVYIHGPPGSGKTTMAMKCAEALGLTLYAMAKMDSKYDMMGFENAHKLVRTPFRDAWEHGGLFLWDDMDRSCPNAVAALNMALANKMCPFADGLIPMHPTFRMIGCGNTALNGAQGTITAAVAMEGSTIDRFYFIPFGYDEALEMAIAPNPEWTRHVQAIRAAIKARGIEHDVTPRASISGGNALAAGVTWEQAEEGAIFKGLDAETVEQVRKAVARPRAAMALVA